MKEDANLVVNSFNSAFILDKPKLTRILNIIENRFTEANLKFEPKFEVTLQNGKKLNLTNIDDLLALDNTIKNPIEKLSISTTQIGIDDLESGKIENVKRMSCSLSYEKGLKDNIALLVRAEESPKQANQIFAEIEEQVERTFLKNWIYRYILSEDAFGCFGGIAGILVLIFSLVAAASVGVFDRKTNQSTSLTDEDIRYFADKSKQVNTIDDKINFIFELQTKQLTRMTPVQNYSSNSINLFNLKNLFILLPLLLILSCIIYLVFRCYPRANFLWGDYEDYYNTLISKRRTLWTVVILALLLGIIGNLFVFGLSGYLKVS